MKRFIGLLLLIFLLTRLNFAQTFDAPPESGRIFALSMQGGVLQIAEKNDIPLPVGTIDVAWNPVDNWRWLRVDQVGILRFVPEGKDGEGVYTFPPFFDGFQVGAARENKVFIREADWSPDGEMIAFRIQNEANPDLNQGVWFWQPALELSTDPSYQILRHCPPFCTATGTLENDAGWRSTSLEWSSDNNAILIGIFDRATQRRALTIRYANRDERQTQAGTRPTILLYDYGHWANDGERLIVSGRNPEGQLVFGTVDRSGNAGTLIPVAEINLAWVQDAIQSPEGRFVMLGSHVGESAPQQLVTDEGQFLTPPIGDSAPLSVKWSPARDAVLVRTATGTYVALTNGTVYDLTALIAQSPNIAWVNGALPRTLQVRSLPAPIAQGELPTATPAPLTITVGMLLRLQTGTLDIYAEPLSNALLVGTLQTGEELIITDGALNDSVYTWYRVQSLNYTGWIRDTMQLVSPEN